MSQCSLPGTGSLVFSIPTAFIKENHRRSPAYFMAGALEHASAVCLDRWQTTANGKRMPSRNIGWQTLSSPVNQNRHSTVGSHHLATQTDGFLCVLFLFSFFLLLFLQPGMSKPGENAVPAHKCL